MNVVATMVACTMLLGGSIVGRMGWGAWYHVRQAHQVAHERDTPATSDAQIRFFRRAIAFYVPYNPWVRTAVVESKQLARALERNGSRTAALHAWHELRSALLSLRGAYQPFSDDLDETNHQIVRLTQRDSTSAPWIKKLSTDELHHLVTRTADPHRGWVVVGLVGFCLWLVFSALLFLRGISIEGTLRRASFTFLASAVVGSFALFCLGMAWA